MMPAASTPSKKKDTWECKACGGRYKCEDVEHLNSAEHKKNMQDMWNRLALESNSKEFCEIAQDRERIFAHYNWYGGDFENVQFCTSPSDGMRSSGINLPSTTPER